MADNPENDEIFDKSTKEIVVDAEEGEETGVAAEVVGPVHVQEPIIPIIDLVSESGSENIEINEEVSSTTDWCQWYRGIAPTDTSTPTNDPAQADARIEYLRGFIQENDRFCLFVYSDVLIFKIQNINIILNQKIMII